MKFLSAAFFIIFSIFQLQAQDTLQRVVPNRINSPAQQSKPYVILISIDGLRWDMVTKYQAKNLLQLKTAGVEAEYLKSAYPSLTFPNHYTIATGQYPSHHGIVDNTFFDKAKDIVYKKSDKSVALDPSWYGGKPLWILAEQQQLLSAVFYWPGSEIEMDGIKPTYLFNYSELIPINRRVDLVKEWLNLPTEKRPHLIAMYFPQVDQAAHKFTADSEETKAAVQVVDDAIGKLRDVAKSSGLDINFIILSDHGMTVVDRENTIPLPKEIDLNHFKVPPGNALLHVYANEKRYIKPTYKALKVAAKDYNVYLSKDIPKAWHYRSGEDHYNRVGDLILVPKLPKVFNINNVKPDIGQHGFDPAIADMHAAFYAWGPQFKTGLKISAFENVHVYPLIAKILGLSYVHQIDGKPAVLAPILIGK